MNTCVTALILAAGSGSRMNLNMTKQKIPFGQETVLRRSARVFNDCESITSVIVVTREDEIDFAKKETEGLEKVRAVVVGGATRAESARRGFSMVDESCDLVAIHDAARCFVTEKMITDVVCDAVKYGAATASSRVTDTVKCVDEASDIIKTVNRNELMLVQTPQVFRRELYKKAIDASMNAEIEFTDDNMMLEYIGIRPHCTDTGKTNIKITTPDDLLFAEFLVNMEKKDG